MQNSWVTTGLRGRGGFYSVFAMLVLTCFPVLAAGTGLHNSSRTFTPPLEMQRADWNDPAEMDRVWQAALIRLPMPGGRILSTTVKELHTLELSGSMKFPTVIYLHGCSGIWAETYRRVDFLAANGYAVIAPPSLARKKYPKSCEPERFQGGLYRATLKIRQFDAGNAIKQAKLLPWVNADRVYLVGLSEGGITAATFRSDAKDTSVRARIVEGWTCHAVWGEYQGIHAPAGEAVLTLLAANDPWFQNPYTKGECTRFVNRRNDGSKSIVYTEGDLSYKHGLLEDKAVQAEVLEFLDVHQ